MLLLKFLQLLLLRSQGLGARGRLGCGGGPDDDWLKNFVHGETGGPRGGLGGDMLRRRARLPDGRLRKHGFGFPSDTSLLLLRGVEEDEDPFWRPVAEVQMRWGEKQLDSQT